MTNPDEATLATLMNAQELIARTFLILSGRDISSRVDGIEAQDPFLYELIAGKINQNLSVFTGAGV